MQQLAAESGLLKGATIPTATSSSYTGPIPGAYNNSPLAQIAGVGSVLAGTGLGQSLFGSPATANLPATPGLLGVGATGAANWLGKTFNNIVSGYGGGSNIATDSQGNAIPGTYNLSAGGGTIIINPDGSKTITDPTGTPQYFDNQGNPVSSAQGLQDNNTIPAPDTSNLGGGDTSWIDNTDWTQYQ